MKTNLNGLFDDDIYMKKIKQKNSIVEIKSQLNKWKDKFFYFHYKRIPNKLEKYIKNKNNCQ